MPDSANRGSQALPQTHGAEHSNLSKHASPQALYDHKIAPVASYQGIDLGRAFTPSFPLPGASEAPDELGGS
ncbi:MAG: hypothetical protein ISR40_02170 [Puniceicoccaceae bacterium]|nr:hypothetical protein [Puniceicoccaceae bacterium]